MRHLSAIAAISVVIASSGCATGTSTGACDPATDTCPCDEAQPCPVGWDCVDGTCHPTTDASVARDAESRDGGPQDGGNQDAGPLKGFGDPCRDKAECESGICILAGTEGFCSRLCATSPCPEGYGCYGMLGVVEQDAVTEVCIPIVSTLCTPCQEDTECSAVGVHLCLEFPDGAYCGRDCTAEDCPTGYECRDVEREGQTFRQCVPESGSCECGPGNQGATRPCTIQTPNGSCQGVVTCLGDQGWGPCEPPSATDEPDENYLDENCDGLDGDLSDGILVAPTGSDSATCGLDFATPCETIGHGIQRAAEEQRHWVFVQAGDYPEVVVLRSGIHLVGGYDSGWVRDDRNAQGHTVRILGGLDQDEGQFLTIRAHDLTAPTRLLDLVLVGPDAQGSAHGSGLSSYVVHASHAAFLELAHVSILAGNGAAGQDGSPGQDAPNVNRTSSMNGQPGGDAREFTTACNDSDYGAGGAPGTNTCPGGSNPNGGRGGNGGTMDTDCGFWPDYDATPGHPGANAATTGLGYGHGGSAGGTCASPGDGQDGRVLNGAGGTGGSGGFLVDGYWYARAGTDGGTGDNGTGGGGGGGSGGCDTGTDSYGAGGGGGGAGGCAALSGGGGGEGGGGSFGLFAVFSTVQLSDCDIQLGNGGDGGHGGTGGRGQSGGLGGDGGGTEGDSRPGGQGGDGGHGGHGGGGGGGAGGISYGIYSYGSNVTQSCSFSGGASGRGGAGGASAPTAPPSERDGNDGEPGADAPPPGDVGTCADPNAC